MGEIIESLLNRWVFLYLIIVIIVQIGLVYQRRERAEALRQKRRRAGLQSDDVFMNQKQRLESLRADALIEAALLVGTVLVTPFFLMFIAFRTSDSNAVTGLGSAFLVLLLWVLFSNAELGKAWRHAVQVTGWIQSPISGWGPSDPDGFQWQGSGNRQLAH